MMSDDLTKLTGPELADALGEHARCMGDPARADALYAACVEAARRLREDTRVWQRALERERDGLRATCNNQRKELHMLNVERAKTLTKLEDAQRELSDANERMDRLRLRGIEEDDSYDPYKRLCDIVDEECGLQPAKLPTGTMLSMIENALFEWRKRCIELEADSDSLLALAAVSTRDLVDLKRKSYYPSLDITPDCAPIAESPFPDAVAVAHSIVSTAELSAFEIAAAGAADAMHVDADGLGFVKRAWLERHRKAAERKPPFVWTDEDKARVVPGCTVVTRGCRVAIDGGHNNGYGDFLYGPGRSPTYDATLCDPQSLLPPEPAERKPHDGRVYGPRWASLDEMEAGACTLHTKDALAHLRELLDERKAIEDWLATKGKKGFFALADIHRELGEVLNGKR
jgi:hypothetical protein